MVKQQNKIQQTEIDAAKQVDIFRVLEYFNWPLDETGTFTLCPNMQHHDKHPKVAISKKANTCRCYVCEQTFDTISLIQKLSIKANGVELPFPKAIEILLGMDGNEVSTTTFVAGKKEQSNTTSAQSDIYDYILKKSTKITKYEVEYLKNRGIFLYPTYVYQGKAYTMTDIKKGMENKTDKDTIAFYKDVIKQGSYYSGIFNILKANHIELRHNYYKNTNYILYVIDYDYDTDVVIQRYAEYLKNTSRKMMIQKGIDEGKTHTKKNHNPTDFCWIAEGIESNDIFICEGMETALSFVQNGFKAISLNSTSNVDSLIDYFKSDYEYKKSDRFILALDHDEAGEKAQKKLVDYFENHNSKKKYHHYNYQICKFPEEYNDVNDYWKDKVFKK